MLALLVYTEPNEVGIMPPCVFLDGSIAESEAWLVTQQHQHVSRYVDFPSLTNTHKHQLGSVTTSSASLVLLNRKVRGNKSATSPPYPNCIKGAIDSVHDLWSWVFKSQNYEIWVTVRQQLGIKVVRFLSQPHHAVRLSIFLNLGSTLCLFSIKAL